MLRTNVVSTNIASVGYEDNILEVEFLNGHIYQYVGVPEYVYIRLATFPHPGSYFAQNVKPFYKGIQIVY